MANYKCGGNMMIEAINKGLEVLETVFIIIMLLFSLWTFWYGVKIETKGFSIELYGVGRYFN